MKSVNLPSNETIRTITLIVNIKKLSNGMATKANDIIKYLLGIDVAATINQTIDADTAEYLVREFGNTTIREKKTRFKYSKIK